MIALISTFREFSKRRSSPCDVELLNLEPGTTISLSSGFYQLEWTPDAIRGIERLEPELKRLRPCDRSLLKSEGVFLQNDACPKAVKSSKLREILADLLRLSA
jgi:hypothetical protein